MVNRITDFYRSVKYFCRNVWWYRKVLWNDRDFDQYYLYNILHTKISQMKSGFENCTYYDGAEQVEQMGKCLEALERLMKDDYVSAEHEALDEKYGKVRVDVVEELPDGCRRTEFKRDGCNTAEEKRAFITEMNYIMRLEYERKCADKSIVFDTIKENVDNWWI